MGMVLRIYADSGLLRAIATGEFLLEEGKRTFLEILDAVEQHKIEKIIFDGRKLKGEPATIHRFLYGEFVARAVLRHKAECHAPHNLQFAYVLQEPLLDPQRTGETAAVNRGMWVKAFDNLYDALGWLRWAPANKLAADED